MRWADQRGFTVLELLVTCGVLAVLAVVASFFLHPRDYGPAERNADRRLAVAKLMTAVRSYEAEHDALPPSIETRKRLIGAKNNKDLCRELVPRYLEGLPSDPLLQQEAIEDCDRTDYDTALAVSRTADGRVTIDAPLAEGGAHISLTY